MAETKCRCPHCNQTIIMRPQLPAPRRRFSRVPTQRFETSTPMVGVPIQDVPGATEEVYRRTQPVRATTVESEVKVPFFRALVGGTLFTMAGAVVVLAVSPEHWWLPLAVWPVSVYVGWLAACQKFDRLLTVIEDVFDKDIDGDGVVGEPGPPPPQYHVLELVENNERGEPKQIQRRTLPPNVDYELFERFATGVTEGKTLGRKVWAEGPDAIMSQDQHEKLIGFCDEQRWTQLRDRSNTKAGRTTTAAGRAAFRAVANGQCRI